MIKPKNTVRKGGGDGSIGVKAKRREWNRRDLRELDLFLSLCVCLGFEFQRVEEKK
jgi:hypothetical protein